MRELVGVCALRVGAVVIVAANDGLLAAVFLGGLVALPALELMYDRNRTTQWLTFGTWAALVGVVGLEVGPINAGIVSILLVLWHQSWDGWRALIYQRRRAWRELTK